MRQIIRTTILVVAFLATFGVQAQITVPTDEIIPIQSGTNFYIRSLAARGVKVNLDLDVANAVNAVVQPERISGYRVCVFSDNGQTARSAAQSALGAVRNIGGVVSSMIYDNPFFRVYAGHCISKTEATILMGRLKGVFPKSFIVPYRMTVAELSTAVPKVEEAEPTEGKENNEI
ncbi:MAG: hypothetical protein RR858_06555 [Mucinivorans sp.]